MKKLIISWASLMEALLLEKRGAMASRREASGLSSLPRVDDLSADLMT